MLAEKDVLQVRANADPGGPCSAGPRAVPGGFVSRGLMCPLPSCPDRDCNRMQWRLEKGDLGIKDWIAKGRTLDEIRTETERGIAAEIAAWSDEEEEELDDEMHADRLFSGLADGLVDGGITVLAGMLSIVDPHVTTPHNSRCPLLDGVLLVKGMANTRGANAFQIGHRLGQTTAHRHKTRAGHNKGQAAYGCTTIDGAWRSEGNQCWLKHVLALTRWAPALLLLAGP